MYSVYRTSCISCGKVVTLPLTDDGGMVKTYVCFECNVENQKPKPKHIYYVGYWCGEWNVSFMRAGEKILKNLNVVFQHDRISGYDSHPRYYVYVEAESYSNALQRGEALIEGKGEYVRIKNPSGITGEEKHIFDRLMESYDLWMNNFSLPAKNHSNFNDEAKAIFYAIARELNEEHI